MSECQIWLDDTKYVVVDPIDYEWAQQWRWHATFNSTGKKFYATRMTTERLPDGTRKQRKVYMHKEILKRAGKRRRSMHHTIGDHGDGDSANNCRDNLTWSTIKQNNNWHRQRHLLQQKGFFDEASA
ncbi:hypothetical protein [Bradyrhizobium sp.]|jgi:hypothetical protein|uniref:hypothetical protein n=1 Tax=Bradyrhizobium sp. TaxID=376 RepID=UPI002DDD0CCF|nr:hypothetical protein [Bradyrhizobium sp.]HEV2155445.1 hypothetical protein [Bradyrhizobium sp.]